MASRSKRFVARCLIAIALLCLLALFWLKGRSASVTLTPRSVDNISHLSAPRPVWQPQRYTDDDLAPLSHASAVRDQVRAIDRVLSKCPMSELDRLASHSDWGLALSAAWERVRRTMPLDEKRQLVRPDPQAMAQFLALVEAKLNIPIPYSWQRIVRGANGVSRQNLGFSGTTLMELARTELITAQENAGQRTVVKDGIKIKLPDENGQFQVDGAAVELAGKRAFVALHGWPPIPYKLFAIDRASGAIAWSSDVRATGDLTAWDGLGWHLATIRAAEDRLVVFGVSGEAAYIEVFDIKTGVNRGRFNTFYFRRDIGGIRPSASRSGRPGKPSHLGLDRLMGCAGQKGT
jgi:hypothetical protein